jgi:hypothetical protein
MVQRRIRTSNLLKAQLKGEVLTAGLKVPTISRGTKTYSVARACGVVNADEILDGNVTRAAVLRKGDLIHV